MGQSPTCPVRQFACRFPGVPWQWPARGARGRLHRGSASCCAALWQCRWYASRKLKHGANKLVLAGSADFELKSTGYITLVKTAENVYKEIGRVATAPVTDAKVSFTGTAIDYTAGTEFVYTGASTATLADILNGAEGNVVRIYGGAAAGNALTIASVAGKISVSSSYVMDTNAKFMELIFVNGVWTEMARG